MIHSKGVGVLRPGDPVPKSVDQLEGRPYDAEFLKAVQGKDHYEAMEEGYFDQEGFALIRLSKIDVVMRMTIQRRILGLLPGPGVRTANDTGVGSTLAELKRAHGGFTLHRIPEPHLCSVAASGLGNVSFLYSNCEKACAGERAIEVYIEGGDYDFFDQEWRSAPSGEN